MLSAANPGAWLNAIHLPATWVFTFVLAIVFPLVDWVVYLRAPSKVALYLWNIIAEWSLVAVCVACLLRSGLTLSDVGVSAGKPLRSLLIFVIIAAAIAALKMLRRRQKRTPSAAQLKKAVAQVGRMIPVTPGEHKLFVLVSLTAGICEEFLYRGWLLNLFGVAFGSIWLGLLISSIAFAFGHSYQGRAGVVGSGVLGVVFGLVFMLSGSLLLGQILHAAVDITNGISLGKLVSRAETS
jgi:uncharacterized protein